jgi:hypothetical protein
MIHGIYLKNRPKGMWHLVTVAASPEEAAYQLTETLKQAKSEGNDQAEVAEQLYESSFWIPHYLTTVKETKPMYN